MNGNGFVLKVSTSAMRETADTVKSSLDLIRGAFDKLDTTVSHTIGYWEGGAADFHRSTYSGYKDRFATAMRRIDEQVTDLGVMAGVYEKTESINTSLPADLPDNILI